LMANYPVQVRNPHAADVQTLSGSFMSWTLPVAGFAIIEAANLLEATLIVSRVPCAVVHGVVDVWSLEHR
jgi:hypothetical protein